LSYAGAICALTAYPGCDVSFTFGDPEVCHISVKASKHHSRGTSGSLVGFATNTCNIDTQLIQITIWAQKKGSFLWVFTTWTSRGVAGMCDMDFVGAGDEVVCNAAYFVTGGGTWRLFVRACATDLNFHTWCGVDWTGDINF
jgi:hypothetical protein